MSDDVTQAEMELFTTGVMAPISYASKPGKIRPIVMTDTIMKLLWLITLNNVIDPNMETSTHVFGKRGACQLVAATVQAALDNGQTVVALDATNAYNTLDRHHTFAYILQHLPFTCSTLHMPTQCNRNLSNRTATTT